MSITRGLRAAYIGEHWGNDCRAAIRNGEIRGRHQGRSGKALKEFVATEFYPFPAASGLPFAAWLTAIAHHDFDAFAPVEVVSLEPRRTDVVIRTGWYVRVWEGETTEQLTLETWMHRGFLFATMRHPATSPRHFRSALSIRIAEPECNACELVEAIQVLEATGLFDFSCVNPSRVVADPPRERTWCLPE